MTHDDAGVPTLIVVAGRPASGKTTLSRALARELGCPVVSRDEIMEGLLSSLEQGATVDGEPKWHVYGAFFGAIAYLVNQKVTLIAEAALQHERWARGLEPLRERARVTLLRCCIDPALARSRFALRASDGSHRARVHDSTLGSTLASEYQPPELAVPTLDIDTSDGYDPPLSAIVSFTRDRRR